MLGYSVLQSEISTVIGVCVLSAAKDTSSGHFLKDYVSCYGIWGCSWSNFYYSILNFFF